jgi:hypothetical protein
MSGLPAMPACVRTVAMALATSAIVSALTVGLYERYVRQPRAPRLVTVDVAALLQAGKTQMEAAILRAGASEQDKRAAVQASAQYPQAIRAAMLAEAQACGCTLLNAASVFSSSSNIADATTSVQQRIPGALAAMTSLATAAASAPAATASGAPPVTPGVQP